MKPPIKLKKLKTVVNKVNPKFSRPLGQYLLYFPTIGIIEKSIPHVVKMLRDIRIRNIMLKFISSVYRILNWDRLNTAKEVVAMKN